MNKYIEALDKLETWSADLMEVLPTVYKEWQNKNKKVEYYKDLKETIKTLQELVEKATPKPLREWNTGNGKGYSCPVCGCCYANEGSYSNAQRQNKEFNSYSYCGKCGQALLWADIKVEHKKPKEPKEPTQLKLDWSEEDVD